MIRLQYKSSYQMSVVFCHSIIHGLASLFVNFIRLDYYFVHHILSIEVKHWLRLQVL